MERVNFKGNSLFWKSKFTVGSYPYHYQIEKDARAKVQSA